MGGGARALLDEEAVVSQAGEGLARFQGVEAGEVADVRVAHRPGLAGEHQGEALGARKRAGLRLDAVEPPLLVLIEQMAEEEGDGELVPGPAGLERD